MLPRTLGRYEVTAVLGNGGMGSVYRARDPRIGRDVAIKLLREGYDSTELRDRFAREARSAGSLSHPNIVTIYDIGEHEGRPFIAMEYVAGETFAELIRSEAPLPLGRKLQMIEEVCAGLTHAHESGIVHRDIKPANLIVDPEGTVKILDFGIARLNASGMTQPGMVIGTLNYMSPEQIAGVAVDGRADIFALGAVLYELLSLRQAFPGDDHQAVFRQLLNGSPVPLVEYCPDIDPRLVRIVDQAMEKKAARRFQTAGSLQRELAAVRLTAAATSPPRTPRPVRTSALDETSAVTRAGGERPASETIPKARAGAAALAQLAREEIESHLAAAERAYDSGDYDQAIASCERVLLIDPAEPRAAEQIDRIHAAIDERQVRASLDEARQHLSRGAIAAASDQIEAASLLSPDHPDVAALRARIAEERARVRGESVRAVQVRGGAALAAGDLAAALTYANQALALDPASPDAQRLKTEVEHALASIAEEARIRAAVNQARRAFVGGEHQAALRLLEAQPASNPLVAKALEELLGALQAIDQFQRAEQERLERQQRVTALVADARQALDEQQFDGALGAIEQAREIDPAFAELAGLTERAQREQAAAQLQADLARTLGDIDDRLGHDDLSGAEESLRAATALDQTDARVEAARASVEHARAERAARDAAEARIRQSEERADEAAGLLEGGDLVGAQESLKSAGLLNPENPRVALLAAQVQEAIDARAAAEAAARIRHQVVELVSAAALPLQSAASHSDDFVQALRRIDEALALDPASSEARDLRPALENALAARKEEARIRGAVSNARRRFANGKHRAAIELLESLQPSSDPLVVEALAELRNTLRQIEQAQPSAPARVEKQPEPDAAIPARPPQRPDPARAGTEVEALLKEATAAESNERAIEILQQALTIAPADHRIVEMILNRQAALSPELGDRPLDRGTTRRTPPVPGDGSTPAVPARALLNRPPVVIGASVLVLALAVLGILSWTRSPSTKEAVGKVTSPTPPAPESTPQPAPTPVATPTLPPAPAPAPTFTVAIVGKYKFEVEFPGGKRPAALRHQFKLPAGQISQIRLTSESVFLDRVVPVRGEADESKTVQAPALSSLNVYNSWNESCEILIDGRFAGYHPVSQQLVSGPHEVSLKCAKGPVPRPQRADVPVARAGLATFTKND